MDINFTRVCLAGWNYKLNWLYIWGNDIYTISLFSVDIVRTMTTLRVKHVLVYVPDDAILYP